MSCLQASHPIEPRELRNALGCFATGVAVVTTAGAGTHVGVTVNSFAAVSLDPPLVLWSLRKEAASLSAFEASGHFIVHILAAEQKALCAHFSQPAPDKFATIEHEFGLAGCPALPGCLARFECALDRAIEAGDHVILIGRVAALSYRSGDPLVFAAGRLSSLTQQVPFVDAA